MSKAKAKKEKKKETEPEQSGQPEPWKVPLYLTLEIVANSERAALRLALQQLKRLSNAKFVLNLRGLPDLAARRSKRREASLLEAYDVAKVVKQHGENMAKAARAVGITRERVRQYLRMVGQDFPRPYVYRPRHKRPAATPVEAEAVSVAEE